MNHTSASGEKRIASIPANMKPSAYELSTPFPSLRKLNDHYIQTNYERGAEARIIHVKKKVV
jgi:hypothetical protein